MSDLAFSLNFSLGASRSIVNKTGLAGSYRVRLVTNRGKQPGTATDTNDGPDIFTALEDQLGLKLEESERTVYTVIVDSVERPTAN